MDYLTTLYRNRFTSLEQKNREVMWQTIYDFFLKQFFGENDIVMDIGAGRCELLNLVKSKNRIAVDFNPDTKKYANKDIQVLNIPVLKIPKSLDGKIDVIILSHFLEHLNSKDEVVAMLKRSHELLKPGGKVLIMQPNIDLTKEAYWDFIDHKVALNTKSIIELLDLTQFKIVQVIERFLPYTTKQGFPIHPLLIKIYLSLPEIFRLFAGQTFIVATKI